MSHKKLNLSLAEPCEKHSYCPHQHYKKCRKERERNIPYTYRPIKPIELESNMHRKGLTRLAIGNVPTIAYERYTKDPILASQ